MWKDQCDAAVEQQFSDLFDLRIPLYSYLKKALFMYIKLMIFTISEMKANKILKHSTIHLKMTTHYF